MFLNTGSISFILYGALILIVFTAMLAVIVLVKNGYDLIKLEKMLDIYKYSITTVAIATVTLIISDLYKEREQQLKELEYFHKYTEDVTKADGIQSRYELTKYLATVSPEGDLKKSWTRYYDSLTVDYRAYLSLRAEKDLLDSVKNPTKKQSLEKLNIDEKLKRKEGPLVKEKSISQATRGKSLKDYRLIDVNGKQFGIGDFIETRFIVGGYMPSDTKDNIGLIINVLPEEDCIITIGRKDSHSGISTNVSENILARQVGYRKLDPRAVKLAYPDVYDAIVKRAALEGFWFKL